MYMYILHIYYTHTYVCMYTCNTQLRSSGDLDMDIASVASKLQGKWKNFHCSPSSLIKFGREGILSRKKKTEGKISFQRESVWCSGLVARQRKTAWMTAGLQSTMR